MASVTEYASYKYRGLTEPDAFRLILLQPASAHEDDLQCTLLHTTLSQCDRDIIDHFAALSYVWGDPTRTGTIYVDGYGFTITATLEAALRDLRDPSRVLRIWADALCIDQSNLPERGSQVGLMAQIYSTAHHTVIHLGPLTKSFETILRAAPSNTTGTISKEGGNGRLRKLGEQELLRLPWFSRVWIFQELILSRDPWVQCGSLRARWTDICNILLPSGIQNPRTKELQVLADMNSARGVGKQKMIVHLEARRGLGATDPRDFIFAHMFLAADTETLIRYVKVDYTKTCAEVFEDAAHFLLEEVGPEGPVKFFPHAVRVRESKIEGLASWAPDWSLPSSGLVPMYSENLTRRLQLNPKFHFAFVSHPLVLAYVGYEVDVVMDFGPVLPYPSELDNVPRKRYEKSANDLESLYGSGAWWSGDENGQHRHVDLRGKEARHEELCLSLAEEWLQVLSNRLLTSQQQLEEDEIETHQRFLPQFRSWLESRAKEGRIMVGGDSDGMESLMWLYFRLADYPAVLTGRRLAITKFGRVAVVPKQVRSGDMLVFLAGSFVCMCLRPRPEDPTKDLKYEVRTAFEAKKGIKDDARKGARLRCDMEKQTVQKCTLVGECYVEGEIGWKYGEERVNDYTIFALR
jgi:Heterokaryon incompatibility protein (HET)